MRSGDPTERFSGRVEAYVQYRPRYPAAIVEILRREIGLTADWEVADIGSGTGFSAEPFLRNGNPVVGVEPNAEMRSAGESVLREFDGFRSIAGTAEETGLPAESVDMVVAGQAFHWFDRRRARAEFRRILRPPGWVVLLWNTRKTAASAFLRDYEALLVQYGTDYDAVRHDRIGREAVRDFFGGDCRRFVLAHEQRFDLEGLQGRLLSSSYVPHPGAPGFDPMLLGLRSIFERHQRHGRVRFEYDAAMYLGRLLGDVRDTGA